MIVVTGAHGFIGSHVVKTLQTRGRQVVSIDIDNRNTLFELTDVEAVIHQGACADTTETDVSRMMELNYDYSKRVLEYCQNIPLIYASSAAVYGNTPGQEHPLNLYGWSKLMFDDLVRATKLPHVVGLRYFNVYGPGEHCKGRMASMIHQLCEQYKTTGKVRLFESGEQQRDFIHVEDVVNVIMSFLANPIGGIYDVGTGVAISFNELARIITQDSSNAIEYFPMPEHIKGKYQTYTQADLTQLRRVGYAKDILGVG